MPFIEVNGAALRYDLTSAGPKTLVLVHEMGGTLESWEWPALSRGRRVLRYDTRGAGLSEKIRGAADIVGRRSDEPVSDRARMLRRRSLVVRRRSQCNDKRDLNDQ